MYFLYSINMLLSPCSYKYILLQVTAMSVFKRNGLHVNVNVWFFNPETAALVLSLHQNLHFKFFVLGFSVFSELLCT